MTTVNVHEAKTHLSRLLERVEQGETVVIARSGRPVARLVPLEDPAAAASRRLGFLRGRAHVPDDFNRMGEHEIVDAFESRR